MESNRCEGIGGGPSSGERDVSGHTPSISFEIECADVMSPDNTYISTEVVEPDGQMLVLVKTKTTVWKCLQSLVSGELRDEFASYFVPDDDGDPGETFADRYFHRISSPTFRKTVGGTDVAVGIPLDMVLSAIDYMTYLFIGDKFYEQANESTKRVIACLRAKRVDVCRKCDLQRMDNEEFRNFVSKFIKTDAGMESIVELHEENPVIVAKVIEAFMHESTTGRMYLTEKNSFRPVIDEMEAEERRLESKQKEEVAGRNASPEVPPDDVIAKTEQEFEDLRVSSPSEPTSGNSSTGGRSNSTTGTATAVGVGGERAEKPMAPDGRPQIKSATLWMILKKLDDDLITPCKDESFEYQQLLVAGKQVAEVAHCTQNILSLNGQGLLHISAESRKDNLIGSVAHSIILALSLEAPVPPDSKRICFTTSLIRSLVAIMNSACEEEPVRTTSLLPEKDEKLADESDRSPT